MRSAPVCGSAEGRASTWTIPARRGSARGSSVSGSGSVRAARVSPGRDVASRVAAGRGIRRPVLSAVLGFLRLLLGVVAGLVGAALLLLATLPLRDRKSTRLNSSHVAISYTVFCLKKKN